MKNRFRFHLFGFTVNVTREPSAAYEDRNREIALNNACARLEAAHPLELDVAAIALLRDAKFLRGALDHFEPRLKARRDRMQNHQAANAASAAGDNK
jgi:hypothetical protein